MSERISGVGYDSREIGELVVHRLWPGQVTGGFSHDYLTLETSAYTQELEGLGPGKALLPHGTIADYYQPNYLKNIHATRYFIETDLTEGNDQYWYIRASSRGLTLPPPQADIEPDQVIAAAYFRPTTHPWDVEHYAPDRKPYSWFENLMVHPALQRRGLGSALIHAALYGGEVADDSSIFMEGYEGRDVTTEFIQRYLGLRIISAAPEQNFGSNEEFQSIQFSTVGRSNMLGLRKRLEDRHSWLKTATILTTEV